MHILDELLGQWEGVYQLQETGLDLAVNSSSLCGPTTHADVLMSAPEVCPPSPMVPRQRSHSCISALPTQFPLCPGISEEMEVGEMGKRNSKEITFCWL